MGQILSEQQRYLSMATDMPDRTVSVPSVSVRSGSVTYPYGRFSDRSELVPSADIIWPSRKHFGLRENVKSISGNLFTMRRNLLIVRGNFYSVHRNLLPPSILGMLTCCVYVIDPVLAQWAEINPSISNYDRLASNHHLTAIPSPPSPIPTLWKATRALVRPCSCWALL